MCPFPFSDIIRGSKVSERARYRLQLVRYAREHGTKPAARTFSTSPQTVRKWCRRYDGSLQSLQDHSRAPHHSPQRLPATVEAKIVAVRKRLHTYGAARLKELFCLPCSDKAIRRVFHQHGLIHPRRTIRRKKNDLRAVKALMTPFARVHLDTKHLDDIPEYLSTMKATHLPRFQYTFREPVSGLQFTSYAQELAGVYAELFAQRILQHLAACGVLLAGTTWQTDNGSEFIGSWNSTGPSPFTRTVEHSQAHHRTIPPRAHTWQSDLETCHRLIEDEFFRIEPFRDRRDFLQKAASYQLFFNTLRPNSSKGGRCPLDILRERSPHLDPRIVLLHPVFLEDILHHRLRPPPGGNHVWSYPFSRVFWDGEGTWLPWTIRQAARERCPVANTFSDKVLWRLTRKREACPRTVCRSETGAFLAVTSSTAESCSESCPNLMNRPGYPLRCHRSGDNRPRVVRLKPATSSWLTRGHLTVSFSASQAPFFTAWSLSR
jgi:transposase